MNHPYAMLTTALAGLCLCRYAIAGEETPALPYTIVDTAQIRCYDDHTEISYPSRGEAFFGQDAHYSGAQPAYRNDHDGTVTDLNTGLMWQADPGPKKTYAQAVAGAARCRTGGYDDWRLPTIKELYSLIQFSGTDPDPMSRDVSSQRPFIDTRYFNFSYGQANEGERVIDSQWATSTLYAGRVMHNQQAMFGVNFADGRIKGYPVGRGPRGVEKKYYALYMRGNPAYGKNHFVDSGDGTVTDRATGLTWMKLDSAALKAGARRDGKLNWKEALEWAEDLEYAGCSDWRLPSAKELHSIVDCTRSPDTTQSAAIDPIFHATPITNEGGHVDYAHYWTGTSHTRVNSATAGVCIAFGRALGFMSARGSRNGQKILMDVHGAGAQRCDAKSGNPATLPQGRGPQGDVMRIYNLVRCVRGGTAELRTTGPKVAMKYARQGPGMSGAGFIRKHDRDGDGKVSSQEFSGPAQHFTDFDRDRDGYISSDEAPTGPPPRRRR